jgi:hypothetical protein
MRAETQTASLISQSSESDINTIVRLVDKTNRLIEEFRGCGDWVGDWKGKLKITVSVEAID